LRYRLIDHTADVGVHIFGQNQERLFENAAEAMFSLMIEGSVQDKTETVQITLSGDTPEDLLMTWLRTLLSLFNVKNLIVLKTRIHSISGNSLSADLTITPFDAALHSIQNEIKAVTYHGLTVEKKDDRWFAQVIFDV